MTTDKANDDRRAELLERLEAAERAREIADGVVYELEEKIRALEPEIEVSPEVAERIRRLLGPMVRLLAGPAGRPVPEKLSDIFDEAGEPTNGWVELGRTP